jgi:hypothetical protein
MIGDDAELFTRHFEHRTGKEVVAHIHSPARFLATDGSMIASAGAGGTEIRLKDW